MFFYRKFLHFFTPKFLLFYAKIFRPIHHLTAKNAFFYVNFFTPKIFFYAKNIFTTENFLRAFFVFTNILYNFSFTGVQILRGKTSLEAQTSSFILLREPRKINCEVNSVNPIVQIVNSYFD